MTLLNNFIFCKKSNIVFAYVPKVACTNWKCILRYLDGHADYLDAQIAHDRKRSGLAYLSTLPGGADLLANPDVPKLTCVRNPYTRILSAYLNKIKPFAVDKVSPDWDPYFHMVFQEINAFRQQRHPELPVVSFRCFLDWLENSGNALVKNEHWIAQTEILGKGEVAFDYMGHFENLATDAPILLERMGCDIPFPSQKAVNFPSTRATELTRNYFSSIEIEQVRRIYVSDFSCLTYDPSVLP